MHATHKNSLRIFQQIQVINAVIYSQGFNNRKLLFKAIFVNQLFHALTLIINNNRLGSREQDIKRNMRQKAPNCGNHNLRCKHSQNRPNIWQMSHQQAGNNIHNTVNHASSQCLTIYAFRNSVQRNPKGTIHTTKRNIK